MDGKGWTSMIDTKKYEGYSDKPYKDTEGVKTIGYGFNLEDPVTAGMLPPEVVRGERNITREEANASLQKRKALALSDAKSFTGEEAFSKMNPERQAIIQDMAYNMGRARLGSFKRLQAALQSGDYYTAANEMKDSKWYRQVGRRAEELTNKMRGELGTEVIRQLRSDQ